VSKYSIHSDLVGALELVYKPANILCTEIQPESESVEYGAHSFKLNNCNIRFRVAKITPTKVGQFVTLWKRVVNGPIQPYDIADSVDLFVISVRKDSNLGQFVFPKSVLYEQGIVSSDGQGGKRAIRVYPPWDAELNTQAKKTQKWQLKYFLDLSLNKPINQTQFKLLYDIVFEDLK
jgi:hypothetical protein